MMMKAEKRADKQGTGYEKKETGRRLVWSLSTHTCPGGEHPTLLVFLDHGVCLYEMTQLTLKDGRTSLSPSSSPKKKSSATTHHACPCLRFI